MIDDRRKPSDPAPPRAAESDDETVQILAGDAAAAARRRASRRLRVPNDPVPRRSGVPVPPSDGDATDARPTDPPALDALPRSIVPPPPDDPSVLLDALKPKPAASVVPPPPSSLVPPPPAASASAPVARVSVKPPSVPPPSFGSSVAPPDSDAGVVVVRQVRRKIRAVGTGEAPSIPPPKDLFKPESVAPPPAPEKVEEASVSSIPVPEVVSPPEVGDDFDVPPVTSDAAAAADSESVDVSLEEPTTAAEETLDDADVEEPTEEISLPDEATLLAAREQRIAREQRAAPPPPAPPRTATAEPAAAPATAPNRPPPPPTAAARTATPAAAEPPSRPAPSSESTREARTTLRDEGPRRKRRPWWEELFNDDYFRTMPKYTPGQVTAEGDFIEASLGVEKGAVVLDVACGAGRQAIELATRGYEVIALDLSLPMLSRAADAAQDRGAKLNFLHSDMREMEFFEMFDAAYCMNTSFGFFEDDKNADVARRLHTALKPGGTLLLDVLNRDFAVQGQPSMAWYEGDGCVCMEETNFNYITSRLTVKRTMIFDDGRQRELEYSIRLYSLHELGQLLHNTGFRIVEVSGHPKTPGAFFGPASKNVIILAQKQDASERNASAPPGSAGTPSRPTTPEPPSGS